MCELSKISQGYTCPSGYITPLKFPEKQGD